MAINYPGPYEVDILYQSNSHEHHARMNAATVGTPNPGDAPTDISLATSNAGVVTLQAGVQAFWDRYRLALPSAASLISWTFYRYEPNSFVRQFITAGTVTNPLGAIGTSVPNWQNVETFRSANGGIMKIEWLEGNSGGDTSYALIPSGSGGGFEQMAAYIVSGSNWTLARDDGWPIAALKISSGQNERLWKNVYRP